MEYKDYYAILGVAKTASADEIKKAFRKAAVKYHPDKNPGDKISEEKFKEITEANEVLSDPEKRRKYDDVGKNWPRYEQMHRNDPRQGQREWEEGTGDFSDFFESLFGDGFGGIFGGRTAGRSTRPAKGQDLEGEITISLEEAFLGTTRRVGLAGTTLELKIHAGVADGEVLRLKGKGRPSRSQGQPGDLLITTHVALHPRFERKGNDLHATIQVSLYTAVLGGKQNVETLKGKIQIDIKPGTANGAVLRLRGMGMPASKSGAPAGDLYARVQVDLPERLTQKEIELFKELRALRKE